MRSLTFASLATVALAATPALAQDLCEGNGYGGAYVEVGPAYLGGPFVHDVGSPNAPSSICFFSISGGFQTTTHPVVGPLCLNVFSPFYDVIVLPTGPDGNFHFELFLPAVPSWVTNPPFYSNVATIEGGQLSISKTVPLWFANEDGWVEVGAMAEPRLLHTATYLGADGRDDRIKVLVAGGALGTVTTPVDVKATTEIFDPLSRTFEAGPRLSVPRAGHTATRLADGRVLIAGGIGTDGACHASAEIYDAGTGTMAATGTMATGRVGHTATLLDDGRVLVAGGFQQYQNPTAAWEAALDSSQASAELYDPSTGSWTSIAQPMASSRSGHSATKLSDGRVLLAGGVSHGGVGMGPWGPGLVVPFFTSSAELFDPATGGFVATGAMIGGRAFHGASALASGEVLITGGTSTTGETQEASSIANCQVWDGATWQQVEFLPFSTAWHVQFPVDGDSVLVAGGLYAGGVTIPAIASAGFHGPVGPTAPATAIGVDEGIASSVAVPLGGAAAVRMHDGALLLIGGAEGGSAIFFGAEPSARAFVYTPPH